MFRKSILPITVLAALTLVMMGCSASEQQVPPTPFPTAATMQSTVTAEPTVLTLTEVNSALGLHENKTIIVSGRLQRQPVLVCDGESYPSPATWALADDNAILLANQFDQQVRQLLPDELTMTVEGQLRRWNGPVGCGKQAQSQEVWYLEVSRILSPSPLTQATLTPEGVAASEQELAQVTAAPEEVVPTPEIPIEEPTAELQEPTPEAVQPTPAPTQEPSPTIELEETPEVTPDSSDVSPTATSGTATATGTPTGTPGPGTPTVPPGTPAATVAAGNKQVVDMGDIFDLENDFPADTLGSNTIHSWVLELGEEELYDIKVIAPAPADIALALYRDGQPVIERQNNAPAGAAEVLAVANQPEGTYQIHVENDQSQSAEYIIILSVPNDFEVELMGFLTIGSPRSNVTLPEFASHYWTFMGTAGSSITITLTPSGQTDPGMYFYGPGGEYLTEMDDNDVGEAEVLEVTIENSGLHTIAVEELSGDEMVYSITIQ